MITKRMIVQAILQTASRLDSCTDEELDDLNEQELREVDHDLAMQLHELDDTPEDR